MKPAYRGVVMPDGTVWAWPMLLWDHNQAFAAFDYLSGYRCRWRQWDADKPADFDPGTSDEDKAIVNAWLEAR